MKVLKIIHTMGHGGAENIFRWLALGLRNAGIQVTAGIPMDNDPGKHENWIGPALDELEIPKVCFDKQGSAISMLKSMQAMIRKTGPDIVHSHLLDANFYSAVACRKLGVPHVCTEHGDIRFDNRPAARIKFGLLSMLSASVVCVSQSLRTTAVRKSLSRRKLLTIYNGIAFPQRLISTFRRDFGIPDNALVVGNVGNLYPVKGQQYLIRAFARLLAVTPQAYLVLVGRGGEEERLRRLAEQSGIAPDRVVFTGFRKDIANILSALDIYVQPSLSEGFPVAVLEAMSLDLPVVATSVGGVPEIITGRHMGILIPPASADAIYDALVQIAADAERFLQVAGIAGAYVRDKFSIAQMTRDYLELYRTLLRPRTLIKGAGGNDNQLSQKKDVSSGIKTRAEDYFEIA